MKSQYDIVIAGAGLVGLTMAVAAAQQGYNVCLIEGRSLPEHEPAENGLRVSAISPSSEGFLKTIEGWQAMPDSCATPFHAMRVWDADDAPLSDRALRFSAADIGQVRLGSIVYNDWLRWSLLVQARSQNNIDIFEGSPITEIHSHEASRRARNAGAGRVLSVVCEDRELTCQLLVGADGARSGVRELANIEVVGKSYSQRGVVATIGTQRPHQATAWQRFLPTGPIALLPLADEYRCSIVWSTTEEQSDELLEMDETQFLSKLSDATDGVLGVVQSCSTRASFPLSMQYAKQYVRSNIALIGDAAHVVHPLAGQGANLGFADAQKLVECVNLSRQRGDSLGDTYALRRYERSRKYQNRKMQLTLDGLNSLFGSDQGWLMHARSAGMGAVNSLPKIKNYFARQAVL